MNWSLLNTGVIPGRTCPGRNTRKSMPSLPVFIRLQRPRHHILPVLPPLLAQFLEVIDLPSAFPIDVDGAQGFGAKDSGCERFARVGKEEYGIDRRVPARPDGELLELRSVDLRIMFGHAGECREEEKMSPARSQQLGYRGSCGLRKRTDTPALTSARWQSHGAAPGHRRAAVGWEAGKRSRTRRGLPASAYLPQRHSRQRLRRRSRTA